MGADIINPSIGAFSTTTPMRGTPINDLSLTYYCRLKSDDIHRWRGDDEPYLLDRVRLREFASILFPMGLL